MNLEKPKDCCICSNSLHQTKKPLSCGHWMHFKCIKKWGNTCPLCRKKLPEIKDCTVNGNTFNEQNNDEEEEEEEEVELNQQDIIGLIILYLLTDIPLIYWLHAYLNLLFIEPAFIPILSVALEKLIPEMLTDIF